MVAGTVSRSFPRDNHFDIIDTYRGYSLGSRSFFSAFSGGSNPVSAAVVAAEWAINNEFAD